MPVAAEIMKRERFYALLAKLGHRLSQPLPSAGEAAHWAYAVCREQQLTRCR
jgi:hypothetical protein